ncbi:hypothetical protein [Mesobacillus harenae]|uniref:hypothetical protein n=1 Tax=Mesobacillus harenae TaxID=2213203 RepID=UPI001580E241|nr:hypothetical protein [Mesobacillus harenae]
MKEVLEHAKELLEASFDHPNDGSIDQCIAELARAKESAGYKGTMISDVINSLENARNASVQLENAGDISATNAYAEAHRALEQAINSYTNFNNDPF